MDRLKVDIMGVSEVRWTGAGKINDTDRTFYYSGGETHERGVGIMVSKRISKCVLDYWAISPRVILIKVKGHPFNMNIIEAYAPTQERPEDEVDDFYEQLEQALRQCKSQEITITMGDFNAKVGKERFEDSRTIWLRFKK